jgi:hypothetical protein
MIKVRHGLQARSLGALMIVLPLPIQSGSRAGHRPRSQRTEAQAMTPGTAAGNDSGHGGDDSGPGGLVAVHCCVFAQPNLRS